VDNSDWMVNGDFLPTRLAAQQDAVNLVTQTKLRSNPESNVGLLSLSDLQVLVTLTTDSGKVLAKLHGVNAAGKVKFVQGIKIAHLALKHRQGKNHKTRIVAFIGSPLEVDETQLVKLAKKLKKEKVNVDVVSFGEADDNAGALQKFVETVNGKDGTGSHLVTIPPGPHLSDALISSPVLQSEDGSGPNVVASGGGGFDFGVDANEDPELAMALRISMEEQRARQQAEAAAEGAEQPAQESSAATAGESATVPDSDEALLQRALQMSMETDQATGGEDETAKVAGQEPNLASMTEEEQIAYAMRMSMQDTDAMEVEEGAASTTAGAAAAAEKSEEDYGEAMNDPAYLQSVLESLPGVDPQSDAVRSAVDTITGQQKESEDKNKKKEDKK